MKAAMKEPYEKKKEKEAHEIHILAIESSS